MHQVGLQNWFAFKLSRNFEVALLSELTDVECIFYSVYVMATDSELQ